MLHGGQHTVRVHAVARRKGLRRHLTPQQQRSGCERLLAVGGRKVESLRLERSNLQQQQQQQRWQLQMAVTDGSYIDGSYRWQLQALIIIIIISSSSSQHMIASCDRSSSTRRAQRHALRDSASMRTVGGRV